MRISSLDDFIRSDYFISWDESNRSNMAINDPERYESCLDEASMGGEGSTHAEIIQDWRDALDCYCMDYDVDNKEEIVYAIDECEKWHAENVSLDNIIG